MKGYDKLMKQLDELADNLDKTRALKAGVEVFVEEAKRIVPVDTGELKNSIHSQEADGDVELVADAPHALFVEFGTVKMEAQPYIRPAIDTKQAEYIKAVAEDIEKQIRELTK